MTTIGTYWRTLRYLKFQQIAGRALFRLGARVPGARGAPPLRTAVADWLLPARRSQSLLAAKRFRFLGLERELEAAGWDPPQEDKLWRYNLHYFDDLNAHDAERRREWHVALLDRWIVDNPPARGTGWEPYPTSLRIVNWIKWLQGLESVDRAWSYSLATQVRWLTRRIEWHLLGNHLFANAKALFVAGLYFSGAEADRWRARALGILTRELREQVLADGGQFERTPMYHLIALEDVLDLLVFLRRFGAPDGAAEQLDAQLRECAVRMWSWAHTMRFDDDTMPRFNDSAEGVAPPYAELARVAKSLQLEAPGTPVEPIHALATSGYVRLRWGPATAFLDVAPVGPDYLPGHAHADTLSFELDVGGRQVVVNRGTSCYGYSPRRAYERSTAAHSTVEVGGCSSSETWSGFRVGRRARPCDLTLSETTVSCAHDGYAFLPGRPLHRRTWTLHPLALRVDDRVEGTQGAVVRYHLAPGLRAERVGELQWRVLAGGLEIAVVETDAAWSRLVDGEQALSFGQLAAACTLELGLRAGRASTLWSWPRS